MDKKEFLEDLVEYMSSIGKPIGKSPVMGYKELDLHQLFCEVMSFGGFHEVVKKVGTWAKIWKRLDNFDASVTDASYRLKKNYERCLLDYEYKCFPENRAKSIASSHHSGFNTASPRNGHKRDHSTTSATNFYYQHAALLNRLSNGSANGSPLSSAPSSPSLSTLASHTNSANNININNNSNSTTIDSASTLTNLSSSAQPTINSSSPVLNIKQLNNSHSGTMDIVSANGVERDAQGQVIVPLDLGELVVESFGTIIARTPFVSNKHIWPIGFRTSKNFISMSDPSTQVKYTSQIIDAGGKPLFVVTAADEPTNPIISTSPSHAWRTVIKRALGKNSSDYHRGKVNISGTQHFGLSNSVVKDLIRELPNADKAMQLQSSLIRSSRNKKRKVPSSDEDEVSEELADEHPVKKALRNSGTLSNSGSTEDIVQLFADDMEDLETAVATLCSLKYSPVTIATN